MEIVIINDEVKAQVQKLMDYAKAHPFSMDDMLDIHNGAIPPIGDRPEHAMIIPVDHLILFSVEDHGPTGLVKHLSISVKNPKFVPSPEHAKLIMPLFGFDGGFERATIKVEGKPGTHQYISLWEPA